MGCTDSSRNPFFYNINKVEQGEAELLAVRNMQDKSFGSIYRTLLERDAVALRTVKVSVHLALSGDDGESLSDSQALKLIDTNMLEVGLGNQPYIIFKHYDTERVHFHVVSTKVMEDGKSVLWNGIGKRLIKSLMDHEKEYNYVAGRNLHEKKVKQNARGEGVTARVLKAFETMLSDQTILSMDAAKAKMLDLNIRMTEFKSRHTGKPMLRLLRLDPNKKAVGRPVLIDSKNTAFLNDHIEDNKDALLRLSQEPETFVIHGDMDATLYSNRQSPRPKNMEMLHEAARSILKYRTWGASVRCNHPEEFVEDAVNGQQFGTVTFDMKKARFVGEDRNDGMLENPEEVIQFADHTGRTLNLFTPDFWDYWRLMLTNLKNWLARLPKKAPSIESIEKAPAPVPPQEPQEPQKQREATLPASEPKPAAMPVLESAPVHRPAAAPAAQDTQPVAQVAQQQTAPTPPPAAKPTILLEYKDSARTRFRIKKEEDGTMKLQQYGVSKQCPTKDGKPNMVWRHRAKFTSFDVLGQDDTYLYLKVKEDGDTKYINQYGNPLTRSQKKRFGISEIGGMNI